MDGTFEMAQALRKSHCDRRGDESHECVGEMTIKRGEICLDCKLCGKGEDIPGWNHGAAAKLAAIFRAAGIEWDCLDLATKANAVREYVKTAGRGW